MKLSIRISLLLFFPLLFAGCIREGLPDCPSGIRVYFEYTSTYALETINPDEVDRLNLYAFDIHGILRGIWIDENPHISPDYYMTIEHLPPGDYRFAAWGGARDCYTLKPENAVIGQTRFEEELLALNRPSDKKITNPPRPLFYAGKTTAITSESEQRINLPLIQNTNQINLTTEGLTPSEDTFRFTISDSNGSYYFDNNFAPCEEFHYTTPCAKDAQGQPRASLTILRLGDDRHPILDITNETFGKSIYTADLMELINRIQVDYQATHIFNIHIKFNTDMSVDVDINGWKVVNDGETTLK